jgi:LysR family glycine cleavage system transcriptional activator
MSAAFRNLPATATLRAFEAAARLRSFTRAADELGLTQGAVSHQIRVLEQMLGCMLFRREQRQSILTPRGETLAAVVRDGLARIADALASARRDSSSPVLRVNLHAGFAVKWLFPRLLRFEQMHPELQLNITTGIQLDDLPAETDVAIRYGLGRYAGLHAECLLREELFPVCSPRLLEGRNALRTPADLARHQLLHDLVYAVGGRPPSWQTWLDAAGVDGIDATQGRRYGQANTVIQAAIEGLGVALGRTALVQDDLAAGRLARPFGPSVRSDYAYYFVCLRSVLTTPKVAAFRRWLRDEAATQRPLKR